MNTFQKLFIAIFIIAFLNCGCAEIRSIIFSRLTDETRIESENTLKKESSESTDETRIESENTLKVESSKPTKKALIVSEHILKGESSKSGPSIAIAPDGIVWIAGSTEKSEGVEASPSKKNYTEGWLIGIDPKKNKSEQIIYNRCFGGNRRDTFRSITIGKDGIIWLAGETSSSGGTGDIPKSKPLLIKSWLLGIDYKKNKDEQIIYNRCFGGDTFDFFKYVTIGEDGILWLMGETNSKAGTGDIPISKEKDEKLWLLGIDTKKSENKQIIYNRCLKGDSKKVCMTIGNNGILWLAGIADISNGIEVSDIFQSKHGGRDIWVLGIDSKKDKSKQIVYGRSFGGESNEQVTSIALDKDGILWVLGTTKSEKGSGDIPKSDNLLSEMWLFGIDSSAEEEFIYNRCFGKSELDFPKAMTIDKDGLIWITGSRSDKITNTIWSIGIAPKKSESEQIVSDQFLYEKVAEAGQTDEPTSIAIDKNGIVWTTGIFKRSVGNDKFQSELWVTGTKP